MQPEYSTKLLGAIIAVLYIAIVGCGATYLLMSTPAPVPDTAPGMEFSSARAFEHIEEIAQRPHPLGSLENARVRDYLVSALQKMGYETEVADGFVYEDDERIDHPQSVYAILRGTASTGAIMITGHYDSVPFGPGAADDCSGIATALECARALKEFTPLKNDIIINLSDGEEVSDMGPMTFVAHHPMKNELKLVLNFEARGTAGPSIMFQTSPKNGVLMREFIKAAPYPLASSAMFDFVEKMPTATDYYAYKRMGYPGFDFAFIGGLKNYHTMNDNLDNLNQGSLQNHGANALALAKHFGMLDLNDLHDEDIVYFNTLGKNVVSYPQSWIWPLTIAVQLLLFLNIIFGFRKMRISIAKLLGGVFVFLVASAMAPIILLIPVILGVYQFGPYALYNEDWYIAGYVLTTLAIFIVIYGVLSRRMAWENLALGALAVLSLLLIPATQALPFGSYLSQWPLITAHAALLLCFLLGDASKPSRIQFAILLAGALPALVLVTPQIFLFFDAFTFIIGPVVMLMGTQLLGLLLPLVCRIAAPAPLRLGALAASVAVLCFGVAIFNTGFSPERPKMNFLTYAANLDTGDACWATKNKTSDEWMDHFLKNAKSDNMNEFVMNDSSDYLRNPAPMADINKSEINVLKDELEGDLRHLSLHVRPANEAAGFTLFAPGDVAIREAKVNGKVHGSDRHMPLARWLIEYRGRCDEGLFVDLTLDATDDTTPALTLIEFSYGLPVIPSAPVPPRPDWMIPQTNTIPISWDFSSKVLMNDPFDAIQFHHLNNSNKMFVRQTFYFKAETALAERN